MNRIRLEFTTVTFLQEMRRQWAVLHPGEPCPVKSLTEYPPAQRSALMASISKAIRAGSADADPIFAAWQKQRQAAAEAAE